MWEENYYGHSRLHASVGDFVMTIATGTIKACEETFANYFFQPNY